MLTDSLTIVQTSLHNTKDKDQTFKSSEKLE